MSLVRQRSLAAMAIGWLAVVGWLTLRSNPAMAQIILGSPWYCVVCGTGGTTDVILNLALFAPFGLLAWWADWSLWRLLPRAFLLTLGIELIQGNMLVGRDATVGDVLANTAGAALGWYLCRWCGTLLASQPRARLTTMVVLALQTLVWSGTGIGMRPDFSSSPEPWRYQLKATSAGQRPFDGAVGDLFINGVAADATAPRAALRGQDSLSLAMTIRLPVIDTSDGPRSIIKVSDAAARAFMHLTQRRAALDLEVPLTISRWRFRTPSWHFPGALRVPIDQPINYQWEWHTDAVELTASIGDNPAPPTHHAVPRSVGLGWVLVHPFTQVIDERAPFWTVVWLMGWFGLLGWSSALAGVRFLSGAVAVGLGLLVVAGWVTQLPIGVLELFSAMAGLGVGIALAAWQETTTLRSSGSIGA